MSEAINRGNVRNVRAQIVEKKMSRPYHATICDADQVLTDYDTFPYPRWWRGVAGLSEPVVAEREAGWRPRRDPCYRLNNAVEESPYPNHCFEAACSTVFPCYPPYLTKYADRESLNVMLNNACIVQYR